MNTIEDLEFGVPEEISRYTAHSAEIAIMILNFILSTEGMNKKEFAKLVGKTPSDITRWISGSHNFTIQTLSLIEAKTGMQIIRNLSDENRKKHLKGEAFYNPTEKEVYTELRNKYLKLLDELQSVKSDKTNIYYSLPTSDIFSVAAKASVVNSSHRKGRELIGKRGRHNVVVRTNTK